MTIESAVNVLRAWLKHQGLSLHNHGIPIDGILEFETLREVVVLCRDTDLHDWDNDITTEIPRRVLEHYKVASALGLGHEV